MTYTKSWIMKKAHSIAASVRGEYATYKAALSVGLRKAWKIAKLSLQFMEVEKVEVINEDLGQEFAQRCMGNIVGEVLAC